MKKVLAFKSVVILIAISFSSCDKDVTTIDDFVNLENELKTGSANNLIPSAQPWGANRIWFASMGVECLPVPGNCFDEVIITPQYSSGLISAANKGSNGFKTYFTSEVVEEVFPGMLEIQNSGYLFLMQSGLVEVSYVKEGDLVLYKIYYEPEKVPEEYHNGYIEENNVFVLRTKIIND